VCGDDRCTFYPSEALEFPKQLASRWFPSNMRICRATAVSANQEPFPLVGLTSQENDLRGRSKTIEPPDDSCNLAGTTIKSEFVHLTVHSKTAGSASFEVFLLDGLGRRLTHSGQTHRPSVPAGDGNGCEPPASRRATIPSQLGTFHPSPKLPSPVWVDFHTPSPHPTAGNRDAKQMSTDQIDCGVTSHNHKRPPLVCGASSQHISYRFPSPLQLSAIREQRRATVTPISEPVRMD
jgi:hypothetical protein